MLRRQRRRRSLDLRRAGRSGSRGPSRERYGKLSDSNPAHSGVREIINLSPRKFASDLESDRSAFLIQSLDLGLIIEPVVVGRLVVEQPLPDSFLQIGREPKFIEGDISASI